MNESQDSTPQQLNPLDEEVRSLLPANMERTVIQLQEIINQERSKKSRLRYILLGWIRGTSQKRIQEVLDRLEGDPAENIIKETRFEGSKLNLIKGGEATRIDRDYYRLKKSTQQSA